MRGHATAPFDLPVREHSCNGEPAPTTGIERVCNTCGASFLGLCRAADNMRGIWRSDPMRWFCSTECDERDRTLR